MATPNKEVHSRQLDWLAEQGGARDREALGCAKNPPVTPLATPKREVHSRQLDWLAEQGGAPDREASGCAKNPPVTPLGKTKTSGLDVKVYFVFVYLHLAWTRKKISLFLYLRFPMTIAIFFVFYPSQIKAY